MKTNLPDFCVSSEAKGFDELSPILKRKFHLSMLPPNFDYYGVRNNEFEAVSNVGTLWTTNTITPQEAIALLTEKQLTVEDLKVGNKTIQDLTEADVNNIYSIIVNGWCYEQ